MSYARFDDQRDGGRITTLREQLSGEVQMQTGKPFEIFQDVKDIQFGQSARDRIETALDEVTFLIPILTPSFFSSDACLNEVRRFLGHEKELDRNDLILPVYYVNHPPFNDEETRERDELAKAIAAHQWVDWRDLRHEPFTSPQIGKMLERMALQIRKAVVRVAEDEAPTEKRDASDPQVKGVERQPARAGTPRRDVSIDSDDMGLEDMGAAEKPARTGPSQKTEPQSWIVDSLGRANFTTIAQAIDDANPGDLILVRPGVYREGLIIEKPLEIIGDGNVDEIVIEARGERFAVPSNYGPRGQSEPSPDGRRREFVLYGVDISQGRLALEDCDITSQTGACVTIHGGAGPSVLRNRIRDGEQGGIYVHDNGEGTIEDNDIFGNAYAGVEVKEGGNPTVRRNRIDRNGYEAIWVYRGGGGTFEHNDLRDNARGAWDISSDSRENVTRASNRRT